VTGYEKRSHNYRAFLNVHCKNAYNLEIIAATDFNLGMMILTSSCYARNSVPRPLQVWVGRARESIVFENHHFIKEKPGEKEDDKKEEEKKEEEKKGEEKKVEAEPDFEMLSNPARVLPAQVKA